MLELRKSAFHVNFIWPINPEFFSSNFEKYFPAGVFLTQNSTIKMKVYLFIPHLCRSKDLQEGLHWIFWYEKKKKKTWRELTVWYYSLQNLRNLRGLIQNEIKTKKNIDLNNRGKIEGWFTWKDNNESLLKSRNPNAPSNHIFARRSCKWLESNFKKTENHCIMWY